MYTCKHTHSCKNHFIINRLFHTIFSGYNFPSPYFPQILCTTSLLCLLLENKVKQTDPLIILESPSFYVSCRKELRALVHQLRVLTACSSRGYKFGSQTSALNIIQLWVIAAPVNLRSLASGYTCTLVLSLSLSLSCTHT